MLKTFFLFLILILLPLLLLNKNVSAFHPECNPQIAVSSNFQKETSDPEQCDASSCYVDSGRTIALRYACYKNEAPTTSTSTSASLPPLELPPSAPGVSCSVDPAAIDITDTTTFRASGLRPNTTYRLVVGRDFSPGSTTKELAQIRSSGNKLETIINPKAMNIGISRAAIRLFQNTAVGRGPYVCGTVLTINKQIGDLKGQKFYRCPKKGVSCEEALDYTGNPNDIAANPNKEECDQACKDSGDTFVNAENILLKPSGCKPGESNCSRAAGEFCEDGTSIKTAIGCVPTEPANFINTTIKVVALISGGLALLLMIMGAFRMISSAGNPESLKAGQEQFASAIIGLLFIIFSVLFLQVIGVNLLNLPGFGK